MDEHPPFPTCPMCGRMMTEKICKCGHEADE